MAVPKRKVSRARRDKRTFTGMEVICTVLLSLQAVR